MILSALAAYLPYALITTFTPGPNNLISFYAVSSRGWKKGANVLAGIGTAILLIMLITAVFSHQISAHMEAALPVLKYFGAAYILWLACKIAGSGPENSTFEVSTFWKGFILVFINIKMLLYALTVFTGYIIPVNSDQSFLIIHAVILTLLCIASNITWAAAGSFLKSFLNRHYRPFNITMALILAYCAVTLIIK